MKQRIDLETTNSGHRGLKGVFETLLRRFKLLMHILLLVPVYLAASLVLGTALAPAAWVWRAISAIGVGQTVWLENLAYGVATAAGFFTYGFSAILVIPAVNTLIGGGLKEWRGPYYSAESFKWFLHNGLTYLVRFSFLEFVTPSPLGTLFYRLMGMKIGKGTIINSTWISDPSMIEMGKKVTIGGSVTIVGHYGQGGLLIIAPVKIGDGSTIGLKSSIMGGARLGSGVKIMPHSVVMPNTVIPDGETWGGVPAQKIEKPASPLTLAPKKAG